MAEQSKNYRYSTSHQVVIDANSRLVVSAAGPCPEPQRLQGVGTVGSQEIGRQHQCDCRGGYHGTGLIILHRREPGQTELPAWKEAHNTSHRKVRARVEHTFARRKIWKILRDRRLKGDGVHHAMLGIA
ncbi:transposase [Streptomyces rubiginosohelvolus]|uniref:transposase n=1 Tax=Streptomyces rubiginosohelvolus TaxID=67362 RepID=UPI0036DEDAB4